MASESKTETTTEKSSAVGDAAKMREALVELRDSARAFTHQIRNSKYSHILDKYTCCQQGFPAVLDLRETIPNANFALAAPPRNCDVGTAEEQFERWEAFCKQYDEDCTGCPFEGYTGTLAYCFARWVQMPYEAEESERDDFIGGLSHGKSANGEAPIALQAGGAKNPSVIGETAKTGNKPRRKPPRRNRQGCPARSSAILPTAKAEGAIASKESGAAK